MSPVKQIIAIIAVALFSVGCYGAFNIDQRFDHRVVAKDDSYFKDFIRTSEHFYSQSVEVNLIVQSDNLDYSSPWTQKELLKLEKIAFSNKFYISNLSVFWFPRFLHWANDSSLNYTGPDFYKTLKDFLRTKKGQSFKQDIKFDTDQVKIIASRLIVYTVSTTDSLELRDAMLTLRKDIESHSRLPAFPIAKQFLSYEQYALTAKETIRNLLIAAVAILFVSSVYLAHPVVILFVFFSFASLVMELFGLMYIWGVSLNGISMLGLVVAIGYSVDYSAHVAHAFVVSDIAINNDRVIRSLSTVGISVVMGGFSTFLGIIVIAFSESELFRIFFRILFGIVVLGLLHGLLFLPVLLSLFCPSSLRVGHRQNDEEENKLKQDEEGNRSDQRTLDVCDRETTL